MKSCNSFLLMNTWGRLASAKRRAASTAGRSSLIFASLVLAATMMLPSAAFAATVGAAGSSPTLTLQPVGGKDPPINFSFNIGGNSGSGSLTATNEGGGQFLATSGTLTMSSTSAGDAGLTYCLVPWLGPLPGPSNTNPYWTSPLGAFLYDDVVTPGANLAFPDIYGLLFTGPVASASVCPPPGTAPASGTDEINIWAGINGTYTGVLGQYSFYDYTQGAGYTISYSTPSGSTDSFNATVVTTTYSYTGNAFNLFYCGSGIADCSTPPSGSPYGTNNSVTAALQLAAPLCSTGPGTCSTAPINVLCSPDGVTTNPNFVALTLNDGVNTVSANTCGTGATAWVTTDTNGNIINWYLDATGGDGSEDIHTLYDPSGTIAAACTASLGYNCYGSDDPKGEDKGTSSPYYGYVLNSPGTFLAPGQGGSTTAGNCTVALPCQNSPISSTAVTAPSGVTIPPNAPITESAYYIPADNVRGSNCGYNGATGLPVPVLLSSLKGQDLLGNPVSFSGLGAEVIPWNVCIPPGGAWVDYVIDEQLATVNGLNAFPSFIAPPGANVQPCPTGSFQPATQLIVGATRKASHTEEQHPEGTFIPAIASCDGGHGSGSPARSVTLFNVEFIQPNPQAKHPIPLTATNQQIQVTEIAVEYGYLDIVLRPLIKFQPASVGTALHSCYQEAQQLIGKGNYNCAAYQTYQCDQILKKTPVGEVGPSSSPLRLPDPYGDLHSRHLTLWYLLNAGAAGTSAAYPAAVSLDAAAAQIQQNGGTLPTQWQSCATH